MGARNLNRFMCYILWYTIYVHIKPVKGAKCRIVQEQIICNNNILNLVRVSYNRMLDSFFQHDFKRYFRGIRIDSSS